MAHVKIPTVCRSLASKVVFIRAISMDSKVLIHFHIPEPDVGGAEVHALSLWKHIDRSRFEISISAPPMRSEFKWFEDEIRRVTPHALFTSSAEEIAQQIIRIQPKVVQYYNSLGFCQALDLVPFRIPGVELIHAKKFWAQDITKTPKNHARMIIGVSEDACRFYKEYGPESAISVRTIWNGIDTARFQTKDRPDNRSLKLLSVARLSIEDKRLDDLIYYFHRFSASKHELHLVGEGPDADILREFAESLGAENVHFHGFIEDPARFYHECDVYVSLSEREGYGLSLAEASAAGMPILAWNCGGVIDLFEDGIHGIIIEDDLKILPALHQLAQDPELRNKLGARARTLASEKFDVRVMAREYEKLYSELIGSL